MDPIKAAFEKVRSDIDFLFAEMQDIKKSLRDIQHKLSNQQTNQHIIPTNKPSPTQAPTHNLPLNSLNQSNLDISTGNRGVPTNKPTNQQTNQHPIISTGNPQNQASEDRISQLRRVNEIIASLDDLKQEVRIKFKQLTDQEMAVFAAIYQFEEQGLLVDYALLAEKFALSEISIRDYIRKIKKKGIEIRKNKQQNKRIILSIPEEIKKIASLPTIQQLRDL